MGTGLEARLYSAELQLGKAAEHLVVVDLLLKGYSAFLSDAGSPFDVVLLHNDCLLTIQVRATRLPKMRRRAVTPSYHFGLRQGKGRHGKPHLDRGIDLYAFVTLDTRAIAYLRKEVLLRNGKLIQCVEFREPGVIAQRTYSRGKVRRYESRHITEFPIEQAL